MKDLRNLRSCFRRSERLAYSNRNSLRVHTIFVPAIFLAYAQPSPYVPTGATMLALALLFGIGFFFGTSRDASVGKER